MTRRASLVQARRTCAREELRDVLSGLVPSQEVACWWRGANRARLSRYSVLEADLSHSLEGLVFWEAGQLYWLWDGSNYQLSWLGTEPPRAEGWTTVREIPAAQTQRPVEQVLVLANYDTIDFGQWTPREGEVLALRRLRIVSSDGEVWERFLGVVCRPENSFET